MIALIEASSYFQLASLAAMADAGLLPEADERILVLANGSQVPELTTPLEETPGFQQLAARFDRVVDFAALTSPRRPSQFNPREDELHIFESLLRQAWNLGTGPLTLVLESIQVNPARALARIFFDAQLWVHSDGLMSYGPTRNRLAMPLRQRLMGTIHVDLIPGLEPHLLAELEPVRKVLHAHELARIFSELAENAHFDLPGSSALILGQYLGSLRLMDADEEFELHVQMLQEVVNRGLDTVLFKAHPSASATSAARLATVAEEMGLDFRLLTTDHLAETVIASARPEVVISCFSTGLATARYILDTDVHAVGTGTMLQALAPYENSNRIPLSIIHALFVQDIPAPAHSDGDDQLSKLLVAVAYCMQSAQLPQLREPAAEFLGVHYPEFSAHFKRRRITRLDLPPRWAHLVSRHSLPSKVRGASRRVLRKGSKQLETLSKSLSRLAK
ncbi:alpha-2,8-polysialyltransferase family protein [Glutamicibacter sp. JL.03c]|uniref:alpha-2,8-polysialyltransferase family protein n=1 Tax=Glutamicibacter sp. JL.03c TaxID=2984842 RepID=UPI0021F6E83F|nr:alpha-2,8-polysialyltransferase family protein [Glutamicibacter sp. JL.03c]UYQ77595.1 alpha-2,8-polysialyltransferase family protein [Glutamicibacter sp. JL.03c]